jgi:hypothetical protein
MEAMELSRRTADRLARNLLVREAYVRPQRDFDAEARSAAGGRSAASAQSASIDKHPAVQGGVVHLQAALEEHLLAG